MKKSKKRHKMTSRHFMAIVLPITSVLLVTSIVLSYVMQYWSTVMDAAFGEAKMHITAAEGTQDWDTDYYGLRKEGMTKEETAQAGKELARRAEEEGIVLLKNKNHALPLTREDKKLSDENVLTVNAFGWSFYYPSTGGSGSGAIGSNELVSPKEALSAAHIRINEELEQKYLDWSNRHFTEWMVTKANGYYGDEDTNTEPRRPSVSKTFQAAWDVPEMDQVLISEACDGSNAGQNKVQIVWIGRGGGEYHDCPTVMTKEGGSVNKYGVNPDKHYLELTDEEEAVLETAKRLRGEDGKVVVIVNTNNVMELGELEDDELVDAILFVGGPGKHGFYAIGDVLNGTVNPSGRLADTYAADLLASPVMANFGSRVYYDANASFPNQYDRKIEYTDDDGSISKRPVMFVGYEEGIYVGYRFYETAAGMDYYASESLPAGVTDKYYNRTNGVVYPFGYGLSYTKFSQNISKAQYRDGVFTFEVDVKNTGDTAGKDVVELYVETPYIQGGIEKAKVVLCGFAKTSFLEPGAGETLTVTVDQESIASYDDLSHKCYVLDEGDYTFYLGTVDETVYGAHSWAYAHPVGAEKINSMPSDAVVFDKEKAVSKTVIYDVDHDGARKSDSIAAVNGFDRELTGNNLRVKNGAATMNRKDGFVSSFPTEPQTDDTVMSEELKNILDDNNYSTKEAVQKHDEEMKMPVNGKNNGIQLISLRGLPYDAPEWDAYIEQWKPADMALLLGKAGFQTEDFTTYGKPTTLDNDGPQAFRHQALGEENEKIDTYYMTAFPCEALLSCTWNEQLLEEIGKNVGAEGAVNGMSGWYAPGLNTHRSAFGGRNFEYFSEDPFLAGKLAAKEISGAAAYGVFSYMKHFAMNEQEAFCRSWCCGMHMHESLDRFKNDEWILLTWANEQTMREIYLKAFEIAVKEAVIDLPYLDEKGERQVVKNFRCATGVMTSFNCVGNTWSGGNYALLQRVLRDEWGFRGTALTDYSLHDFMYPDQMIRNGGTACLQSNRKNFVDQGHPDAMTVSCMQNATKQMCYMVVHSNAMNGVAAGSRISYSLAPWEVGCVIAVSASGILFIIALVLSVRRVLDEKKHPEQYKGSRSDI